jgi:hypothetical protein
MRIAPFSLTIFSVLLSGMPILFRQTRQVLDEANAESWVVIDMNEDWKTIFPPKVNAEPTH